MDTSSIIVASFLSTIPVYLFFATGFFTCGTSRLFRRTTTPPIMQLAMDVAYPCLVFHSIMKYMVLSGNKRAAQQRRLLPHSRP